VQVTGDGLGGKRETMRTRGGDRGKRRPLASGFGWGPYGGSTLRQKRRPSEWDGWLGAVVGLRT